MEAMSAVEFPTPVQPCPLDLPHRRVALLQDQRLRRTGSEAEWRAWRYDDANERGAGRDV